MNSSSEDLKTDTKQDDLTARKITLDLLSKVLDRKTALDVALDQSEAFAKLETRDRGFVRMLLTTTLRRLGQIDDLIISAQNRPNVTKTPVVLNILRLGVTQLFFMDVPDHAAVDTSVRLTEDMQMTKQKGFVNAILRSLIRNGRSRLEKQDSARLNVPEWLLKMWIADYGIATAAQIAESHMREAPLDITVKNKDKRSEIARTLDATELTIGTIRRASGGNVRALEGFDSGKWWVQDAAAALPATLFGDLNGHHVIDMCAAPGGKTLQLAANGAQVTAIDRSAKRLKRLEENLVRMELQNNVTIEVSDAASWRPATPPTHMLLDAPCSATGTMRRHPDTGYLKSPQDIEGLTRIQTRLLDHAAEILSVDGVLIYCTCSLQKDEGERQIDDFLNRHKNFKRLPITTDEVGRYERLVDQNGDVRILPFYLEDEGGIDGFFISRLKKS